jgi:hypothetical protein
MSQYIDLVARLLAYEQRRAILIRQTSAIALDPNHAFGIAPIRVVSEERVQAVAFGTLGRPPTIVATWNPLDREVAFLKPLAEQLHTYLTACIQTQVLPRIWLPHQAALDVLDILGHRYRTNQHVSNNLRRMGWQCRALADEASYPGQQVVAIATDLLTSHIATGQTPAEDRHLRAVLAWINPPTGIDPAVAAEELALVPAAAMLSREEDDAVEALRQQAYADASKVPSVQVAIERLLRAAAQREWELLSDGRRAFWGLGLRPTAELNKVYEESFGRFSWRVGRDINRASRPHSLTSLLEAYEFAQDLTAYAAVQADAAVQEREVRTGRLVRAEVVAIDQPNRNRHPCTLTLRSRQDVLRVRRGTRLALVGYDVDGRVVAVQEHDTDGSTLIELRLDRGVRAMVLPRPGSWGDWGEPEPFDGRMFKSNINAVMQRAADPRVYGDQLPEAEPRALPTSALSAVAERLRKR